MGQDLSNQIITNLLIERLNNATDDSIRLKFATLLSLINPKEALSYLQNLLTSQAEEIRLEAACTLQEIWPNNFQVIQTLNNLLNCKNDWLVYRAATRLEAINLGSINAQKAFNKLLNSKETEIVLIMAKQWRKIKVSPSQLVNILFEIVRGRKNEDERKQAARTLLEIEADERNITKAIIKLLYTQLDEETHRLVAWYLGKIIPARSETIKALIECLSSPISQSVRCQAVVSLGQVGERNGEAVSALISLLQSSVDEYLRREVVFSLRKIAFDNLNAIRALEKLVDETRDEETCFQAACALNQISTDKSKGIEALKKLTSSRQTFFMQFGAAMALCRQLPGDINIIKILIELLLDNRRSPYSLIENFGTRYVVTQITITDFLKPLVTTEQLPIIINTIKSYKSRQDAVSRALYRSFGSDIIWHYAQNLTYDKFYQACRGE
jgi:HEAT repeat protein